MESQISVTVPATPAGAVILRKFAATLDGAKAAAPAADDAPAKGKRGRPSKAEMEARKAKEAEADEFEADTEEETEEDETEEDEAEEETEEDETEEDDAEEEEAPPAKKKKTAGLSLEADIIPAFQAYAKRHSREKAGKILAKFKAKAVRDIPAAKFPEVLKLLKG